MKKVFLAFTLWLVTGCAHVASPALGAFFTQLSAPGMATANTGTKKVGEGVCTSVLGIVAFGDCSIETAKRSAGITKVATVDTKVENYFVFAKLTTIVYGE